MTPLLRRLSSACVLLAGITASLTACGDGDDRPSAADWEPVWVATQAEVPEPAELDDGADVCTEALGELRASREELLPSPSPALDERVRDWLGAAEGLALDCPDEGEARDEAYDDVAVLAAEIEAALDIAAAG